MLTRALATEGQYVKRHIFVLKILNTALALWFVCEASSSFLWVVKCDNKSVNDLRASENMVSRSQMQRTACRVLNKTAYTPRQKCAYAFFSPDF